MTAHNNIIDSTIKPLRSRELMRLIIPILIQWAKIGKIDSTYDELIHAIGYSRFSGIGKQLEFVQRVIDELHARSGIDIPTLNSIVKSKADMLPSEGFSFISERYNELNNEEKKIFVAGLDSKAIKFQKWDWVLNQLELKPTQTTISETELQSIVNKMGGQGGEGEEHKRLKNYILEHPESIGLTKIESRTDEFVLPSGDRIDAYFIRKNGDRIAVEVKPSTSPDEEMTRGIFQCVKYKAVMEAVRTIECGSFNISTLLVIGSNMSQLNKSIAKELKINYIDSFKY